MPCELGLQDARGDFSLSSPTSGAQAVARSASASLNVVALVDIRTRRSRGQGANEKASLTVALRMRPARLSRHGRRRPARRGVLHTVNRFDARRSVCRALWRHGELSNPRLTYERAGSRLSTENLAKTSGKSSPSSHSTVVAACPSDFTTPTRQREPLAGASRREGSPRMRARKIRLRTRPYPDCPTHSPHRPP